MTQQASSEQILEFAIDRSLMVSTAYNRGRSVLAPHSLFTKHDELYLRAVTVERDGRPPREAKLGTFKLIGLSDLALTGRTFDRDALFAPLEALAY
ncbi:MAG TPA: hypothetical protein VIT45_06175 [Allosphingosinicella sp.]